MNDSVLIEVTQVSDRSTGQLFFDVFLWKSIETEKCSPHYKKLGGVPFKFVGSLESWEVGQINGGN